MKTLSPLSLKLALAAIFQGSPDTIFTVEDILEEMDKGGFRYPNTCNTRKEYVRAAIYKMKEARDLMSPERGRYQLYVIKE